MYLYQKWINQSRFMVTLDLKFWLKALVCFQCLVFNGIIKSDQKPIKTHNISTMIMVGMQGGIVLKKG